MVTSLKVVACITTILKNQMGVNLTILGILPELLATKESFILSLHCPYTSPIKMMCVINTRRNKIHHGPFPICAIKHNYTLVALYWLVEDGIPMIGYTNAPKNT